MNRTLGAPSLARSGSAKAGAVATSNVCPMTPLKAILGLYPLQVPFVSPLAKAS